MDDNGSAPSTRQPSDAETASSLPLLDVDKARDKAKAASSAIYEMIDMRTAKVTEPGPSISTR
ncbi:hypothetical protein [Streptomyces sp. SID4985]|uniref:hypothetical protein n=1 Tax=unclassified Streptomyces TaxID=2593676 RepID=UPI00136CFEA8|nr:hypothetical protein [Streptomyces sp. SID4985]MYQ46297.1 hypothetical protein [Streptomyces sp. SID4985]